MRPGFPAGVLPALLLTLGLAGCGDGDGLASLNPFDKDVIEIGCPPLGALKQAESLTRFRPGDGRDLTDVELDVRIGRVVGECQVSQSRQVADVKTGVELLAERGPALQTSTAPIAYFVAIQDPDGEVVGRQEFQLTFDFEEGLRETRAVDYLAFQIPNATPERLNGFRIYVGLQMTEAEWAFSQRSRSTR